MPIIVESGPDHGGLVASIVFCSIALIAGLGYAVFLSWPTAATREVDPL